MKKKLYVLTLLLILSSCKTTVFKNYESCQQLTTGSVCTDKRREAAPKGCYMVKHQKHTYICNQDYSFGFFMTNVNDFMELKTIAHALEKENKQLKRKLEIYE